METDKDMIRGSFRKKIGLIYLTRTAGFITGLASVFLVIPLLSSNPSIFGIYTVCISMTIFFSYADLGFVASGQKYAAEYFARGDKDNEIAVVGFVSFLLMILMLLISCLLLIFLINPGLLVKNINSEEISICRKLLGILLLSVPITLLQRFNLIVYSVRLDDYLLQTIDILANALKIFSITLFVTVTDYNIVGYYMSIQILSLLAALIAFVIAIRKYQFDFVSVLKSIRFSKDMYVKTKELALSSLLLTISWILYFELDPILLSKLYGLKTVAFYAVGFSILSFCRNMYNTMYSPFQARFNHLIGLGRSVELKTLLSDVIKYTLPICIIPPVVLIIYMQQIILTWVGPEYLTSISISRMLVISNALLAIGTPLSYFLIANSRNRILRISALVLPFIFYGLLLVLRDATGDQTLAIAKTVTVAVSCALTFYGTWKVMGNHFIINVYGVVLRRLIIPLLILCIIGYYLQFNMTIAPKSFESYMLLAVYLIPALTVPLIVYYLQDKRVINVIRQKCS